MHHGDREIDLVSPIEGTVVDVNRKRSTIEARAEGSVRRRLAPHRELPRPLPTSATSSAGRPRAAGWTEAAARICAASRSRPARSRRTEGVAVNWRDRAAPGCGLGSLTKSSSSARRTFPRQGRISKSQKSQSLKEGSSNLFETLAEL
jgi:hypothetical protein